MATQENNQINNQQWMQLILGYLSQIRGDHSATNLPPMNNFESQSSQSQSNIDPSIQNLLYFLALSPQSQLLYAQLAGFSNNFIMPNQRIAQLVALQNILQNLQPTVNNMYFHNTTNQLNNINLNLSNCAHSGTQLQASPKTKNEPSSTSQGNLKSEKLANLADIKKVSNVEERVEKQKYSKKENIIKGNILWINFNIFYLLFFSPP